MVDFYGPLRTRAITTTLQLLQQEFGRDLLSQQPVAVPVAWSSCIVSRSGRAGTCGKHLRNIPMPVIF